jgi:putative oxidoreductase
MIAHGVNHARTIDGTANWFEKVGFRSPRLNAYLSAGNELAIGAALVIGLLTPAAAAGLAATMFVAFWSIHRPDEGYEYVATLAVLALVAAIVGPGAYSVDALLGWDEALTGVTGLVIYTAGIGLAVVQLAVFWRRPEQDES